jgi:hypothetical protein
MPGSTYSQDTLQQEKEKAIRTSKALSNSCVAGFVGGVLLLIAFCSPYWLQSWSATNSPFINMGIWEICFFRFRYPKMQKDILFTGCNPIWGNTYRDMREWILPTWLMFIQFLICVCFLVSFVSQMFDVGLLLRWPLERVLRFEYQLVHGSFISKTLTAVLLFIIVALFGGSCWDRGWLLYPNYNYVSWSYAAACFSMVAHGVSAYFMYLEARDAGERRSRNMALVMQMYPTPGLEGSIATWNAHGSQFI